MSEIRHLIDLHSTHMSDQNTAQHPGPNDSGQKEPKTSGEIKETQTERLKMFFERLRVGRGDGEVSVELGFWTGLANEVWQVSRVVGEGVVSYGNGLELRGWLIRFGSE
jgi:hypothetical protein